MRKTSPPRLALSLLAAALLIASAGQARGLLGSSRQSTNDISRQRAAEAARQAEAAAKASSAPNLPATEPTAAAGVKAVVAEAPSAAPQAASADADLEQRLKAEQNARKEAEAASQQKLAELEARLQAERDEAARAVAETQKRLAELEARLQAEQAAKLQAEQAAKQQAEQAARQVPQEQPGEVAVKVDAAAAPVKRRTTLLNPFKDKAGDEAQHEYTITAERMEMTNNVIELNGNVKIEDETMLMTAEKMLVYLQDTDPNADRLEKAEAFGAVTIRKLDGDESATGDRGTFDKVQGTIVLDGNCTLMQGKNVMQCRTIIYDLNSQKIKAIGATLNLQTGKGAAGQADFFGLGGANSRETSQADGKK